MNKCDNMAILHFPNSLRPAPLFLRHGNIAEITYETDPRKKFPPIQPLTDCLAYKTESPLDREIRRMRMFGNVLRPAPLYAESSCGFSW